MMKYEFETIKTEMKVSGGGFSPSGEYTEHRRIIDEYADKGYRYVGQIPAEITANGIMQMDLIFETQV